MSEQLDLLIVGGGPSGLAAAICAKKRGLSHRILEKGCLVNSIYHFPTNMVFFTTPELLEIGGMPLVVAGEKPRRQESLNYYRRVADSFQLPISLYEKVTDIVPSNGGGFEVRSIDRWSCQQICQARSVILAMGYYDNPNLLCIPGESLPKVSHYYTEPHPYYGLEVAVIGGRNSAAETALDLYRHGARVTLIHRGAALGKSIKYWVLPDIQNRINRGEINACLNTTVVSVQEQSLTLKNSEREWQIPNDFVFALTGYHPDVDFLRRAGVEVDPVTLRPCHDPVTFETNVPGMFVAGGMTGGLETNHIFIENGRFHGEQIVKNL